MTGSCFLGSFVPGVNAAPNGLDCSSPGLVVIFVGGAFMGEETLDWGFEVDVNFELRLDIHEFRRPCDPTMPALVSLVFFVAG